mmetsp:Transcript_2744/g.7629  ORF Transcript_2744/g.7629 Transcript_2744/m.7629 type:complete len:103 (+) Transcript_2744:495-803(+)
MRWRHRVIGSTSRRNHLPRHQQLSYGSPSLPAALGPMWQLAFACALRDTIQTWRKQHQQANSRDTYILRRPVAVEYDDPCMTPADTTFLFHTIPSAQLLPHH